MKTLNLCAIVALASCAQAYGAITVTQHNGDILESDWQPVEVAGQVTITIITSYADQVYVFEATENGQPAPIAAIDTFVTAGTIKLMIAGDVNCSTPGAAAVKKIAIDPPGVTSIIECINITGDLLETEAMTVDSISGDVLCGTRTDGTPAALHNAVTVNGNVDGHFVIGGETDGAITINGNVNRLMVLMGHVNAPIVINGDLKGDIKVFNDGATPRVGGDIVGNITIGGDLLSGGHIEATGLSGTIWIRTHSS